MNEASTRLVEANPVREDALDQRSFTDLWRRFEREQEARRGFGATVDRLKARPRALGLVIGVLIAAASAAAAVSLSGGHAAPVRLPGGGSLCPAGFGYGAYASLGVVYPPNFPGALPRHARLTSCFGSPQDAHAAGYRLASTPRGDRRLGPLYLAPVSVVVRRTCRAAQRRGVPVSCPRLLPAPWTDPTDTVNADCPSAGCSARLLRLWGGFTAPSPYVGSAPGVGEVTVWAASSGQRRLFPYLVGCPSATAIGRTVLRGHPAAWYECSIFGAAVSSVLKWQIGTVQYGVSANGPAGLRQRLVRSIARQLVGSAPTR
jgi:hypothetical protein